MTELDAVVVGAGPNGLVAAAALAEAGMSVLVLEAADVPGGALRTEEVTLPGFRHDIGATVLPLAAGSPAFRAIGLDREGLRFAHPETPLGHVHAGGATLLHRSAAQTAEELGRDGRAWLRGPGWLGAHWERVAASVLDPTAMPPHALRELLAVGLHGSAPATFTNRLVFRDEPTRALFAGLAAHSTLPLGAPLTSVFGVFLAALAHGVGWPVAVGGSQSVADALVTHIRSLGGEVRTGHRVRSLDELPEARAVLLDLTPRQIVQIAGDTLPSGFRRRLDRWRYAPGVFKVDWALDAPVPWRDERLAGVGTVHLGASSRSIAESERRVARGGHPDDPFVIAVQATAADPTRAPAGRHTLWAYCHVPNGSSHDMTDAIESRIEAAAPGFRERVLARHVMPPAALEAWNANLVGGDIGGGSADWRQMLSRPRISLAPWRLPIPGVYVCSSSALPAGGSHGMGGWNVARTVLADLG
ncbi:NAD(P)/FAD-dependent oxidoreductase [Homoserinibacter sp. GY 40078]|uniref:phytoene desaturase family protein n=1 Tax=Homoserinibacter sp. GY 40078 TaxID=2603275 RepID=UPI0011CBC0DA|nr:NAD(P)/FAD-dependent oxidoreductase [Homoserinibacter sp. GY 40078]TXK18965.1 NAD(P)/FAD-dependent oxidoreductase [Homoserinibacter sp. GY 40078]